MDWFCGCNVATISEIHRNIKNKTAININELVGIARLNATLFNFSISSYVDNFELGRSIHDIDIQYDAITAFEIMAIINECHAQAGIQPVSEKDVERELLQKREQIRKLISDRIQSFSEVDYIEFVTMLAERYIADEDYDGVVIADVIDQYELKMQPAIEVATGEITVQLSRIKRIASRDGIEVGVANLIRRLKRWDELVQPLQLKSKASGAIHEVSERVARDVREICLWLHNEQGLTEIALSLVEALQNIFAEIGSLADVFEGDSDTLSQIISDNKESEEIGIEIKAIGNVIERWKTPSGILVLVDSSVNDLNTRVKALDARIKAINADAGTIVELRTTLCYIVREGAVYIHNEAHKTEQALSIAKMLLAEFGDIGELRSKLLGDISALSRQEDYAKTFRATRTATYQPTLSKDAKESKKGWVIWIILLAVIIIGNAVADANSSSSSVSNTPQPTESLYSESNESPTSDDRLTVVRFSNSVNAGTDVYTDIVSIFPDIGIYTEGSSNYTHFVCECETSTGSFVWVYMTVKEYRRYFNSDVSTSIYTEYQDEEIFSSNRRIYGIARRTESIMTGLSSDTGKTMLIDFESIGN